MDTKKLNLAMNILKIGLVAIGVIAAALILGGPNMDATEQVRNDFRDGASMGLAINYTLLIIIASVAIVLLFFVVQLITNPKKTVKSIIGLIVALLLFALLYMLGTSDTNETIQLAENKHVSDGTLSATTAGIYTTIIGVAGGVLAWVLSPLMGRLRK